MKAIKFIIIFLACQQTLFAQHYGIVRKNYFSYSFDSLSGTTFQVLDSSTIRLGSINPTTGYVTNSGSNEFNMGINLTGATTNPYANKYLISSGSNILTFDLNTGAITGNNTITGPFATSAFQNYRFNPSDTVVYGLIPNNFYSTVFDSSTMSTYQVLDSSHIRFAKLNPDNGIYTLIGNTNLDNVYTLAGNAIDPHQMLYYYSAVDTLVAIDLYNGSIYSQTPIQTPPNAIFENFTYSCADTSVYGLVRQNYITSYYDSVLMQYIDVVDSISIRLSKINPTTGALTIISPYGLAMGATLNGSCFIDPSTMTYYFSNGPDLIGVSLQTGLIVSNVVKTFPSSDMYFEMMRSTNNCLGALKVRTNAPNSLNNNKPISSISIHPNPTDDFFVVDIQSPIVKVEVFELNGKRILSSTNSRVDTKSLATGIYIVKVISDDGKQYISKLLKK